MIRLIVNFNTAKSQIIEITDFPCTIGRSKENDVHIDDESLSDFHLRIESKGNDFIVRDLNEETNTFFKNDPVKDRKIEHDDVLQLGKVNILFQTKIGEAATLMTKSYPSAIVPKGEEICQSCGARFDPVRDFCPMCGYKKGKYLPSDIFISPIERKVIPKGAGVLPILSFIFSIIGPLLLGIGWIVGIFLGIISLSAIRKRGGFARDRRLALSAIVIGLLWFVIISISGAYYFYHWKTKELRAETQKLIASNEKEAIIALRNIGIAEKMAKSSFYSDKDSNGVAEYIPLKDLDNLNLPSIDKGLSRGKIPGYKIEMPQFNEENFICEAVPDEYRHTGKRSFMIAADGFIRGSDIGGASIVGKEKELPILFAGKSVFTDYNEEIARRLLTLAEEMAKEGNYEKSKLIIDEIRANYPLTEVQEELDSVASSVEPFIINFRSKELYEEARKEIDSGDLVRAKNILEDISKRFPTCEIISDVKQDLDQMNFKIDEKVSQEAKTLFEEAKLDHQAGKYEEAIKKCRQIVTMYPDTQYVQKNTGLLQKMIDEGEEKLAEKLLKQIMESNVEKDFMETKRVIDLLGSVYKDTDIYQDNKDRIDNIMNNCIAHGLLHQFLEEKQRGEYRIGLTHLQKAIEASANIKADVIKFLPEVYAKVGTQYFNESDYLTACEYYEKSISLDSGGVEIDKDKLKKAFYEVARISYEKDDYTSCKDRLMGMEAYFQDDKEFNYLLANSCIKLSDYDNAIKYYSISHNLNRKGLEYLRRRGLAHIALALKSEGELANKTIADAIEKTNEVFLEVSKIIVDINDKVEELKPSLILGSKERERSQARLEKEIALAGFITRRDDISKRAMASSKNDTEVLNALDGFRNELKDASSDLKKSGDITSNGEFKEIETKVEEKLILIEEAYKTGFKSLKKICAIRDRAVQRLHDAVKGFQREFMLTTTTSDLYYRSGDQMAKLSEDIIKCSQAVSASQDIAIDVQKSISKLDQSGRQANTPSSQTNTNVN